MLDARVAQLQAVSQAHAGASISESCQLLCLRDGSMIRPADHDLPGSAFLGFRPSSGR